MKYLGNASYVLRIQIIRYCKKNLLALSQASYIEKLLMRYNMQNSKKGYLPSKHGVHISKEQCPKTSQEEEDMRRYPYAFVVGSLMYAMQCTRLDICYEVSIVSKLQSNPRFDHWTAVKCILKYLRRARNNILQNFGEYLSVTGYTNSNFQTDRDDKKSISRSVFTLGGGAIVWRSIKQRCVANSTMEVEYVATSEASMEVIWLQNFFIDLEVVLGMEKPIDLYYDNIRAIANIKKPRHHKRTKHIKRRYHLIRSIMERGDVNILKIAS